MGFKDILILVNEKSDALSSVDSKRITKIGNKTGIDIENFINLAKEGVFKKHGYIHEILEQNEICLLSTPSEPRNPELEARVQKLKAEQENEEYKKMVKGLDCSEKRKVLPRSEVKEVTSQVTAVINFVVSVVGSFFFTFKAVEYALPESNIPAQVMGGIITSTVVAVADLYFLLRTI